MNINNLSMMLPIPSTLNPNQFQNINQLLYFTSPSPFAMHPSISQQSSDLKQRIDPNQPSGSYQGFQSTNNILNPLNPYPNLLFSAYGDHLKGYLANLSSAKLNPALINKSISMFPDGKKDEKKMINDTFEQKIIKENENSQLFQQSLIQANFSKPVKKDKPTEIVLNEKVYQQEIKRKNSIEKIKKKIKKPEENTTDSSVDQDHEMTEDEDSFQEDEAYIPNNRRIKKSIESTPRRILRDRIKESFENKDTPEIIQKRFSNLIQDLEILLEYNDIDRDKLMQLFIKVDHDPQKIITKVKRSRTYYRKYFKMIHETAN